jgi:hypothetical protein
MVVFVIYKRAANVVNLNMTAFVNDGCNPLLMMTVIIVKIFIFRWFQYATVGR